LLEDLVLRDLAMLSLDDTRSVRVLADSDFQQAIAIPAHNKT